MYIASILKEGFVRSGFHFSFETYFLELLYEITIFWQKHNEIMAIIYKNQQSNSGEFE